MTVPSWLNLSFTHSKSRSPPFSGSGISPRSEIRSVGIYLSKFTDIQYGFTQQNVAGLAASSPKQHRFRPPPGIQHWFEAFDDCFLNLDSHESLCHLDVKESHQRRIERLSMERKLLNRTDLRKANDAAPGASNVYLLQSNSTTEPRLQPDLSPSAVHSTSCCNPGERESGTTSSQLLQAGPAGLTSYFDVSPSSTPSSSLDQQSNDVSDGPLSDNWLQTEDENDGVLLEEAEIKVGDDSLPLASFKLHKVATQQHETQSSLELENTNRASLYSPTSYTTGAEEVTQRLKICPISPLDCRFSCMLSRIEFHPESVLLNRRRRHLPPLNLTGAL